MRPTIGYLAYGIGDNVSQALWTGIVDAARERGANLICFAGDRLRDITGSPSPANVLYDLASASVVDGLVSWASAVGGYQESDKIAAFHRRYHPLPIVSITLPMEGCPTIVNDSYQGMRAMVAHLIESHGYHRLAFIRGPEEHYYAQERYRAYADALEAYGIPLDPKLVTAFGDFFRPAGVEGIRSLLDERGLRPQVDFDAVVTVSDLPALGALEDLQARGIRVPEDVALVGFNGVRDSRFATPPLTTVRLPFYEQGQRAVETLLAMLDGEQVPRQVVLSPRLVIRQSCGCVPPSVIQAAVGTVTHSPSGESFEVALATRREAILNAMVEAAEAFVSELDHSWAERLLDSLIAEVSGTRAEEGAFLPELGHLVRPMILANSQVARWQNVVSALRRQMLPCFSNADTEKLHRAEDLWAQARVFIGEAAQRTRGYQMVQGIRQTQTLRQISQSLVTAFDVAELADVLARDLPSLGIERCYLSLYENPQEPTDHARLIMAYDEHGCIELAAEERTFASDELVPAGLLSRTELAKPLSLVAEPLNFREEQIGFVLFGVGPMDGTVYEVLRGQISSALKGALLLGETREARATAEKADRLKTRLLANVSHELRTPLNVIIGCTRELLSSPTPYNVTLPEELLSDLLHVRNSAEHQLRVINDLLDLSRAEIDELDLYPEVLDPLPLLQEAFFCMMDADTRDSVTWHLRLPERLPKIQADPVRLRQILLNLLSNASKFVERDEVILGAEVTPPHLHIWVQDTGPGIPLRMQERIFDPFVTAGHTNRRLEGVGLGLSIARRLVALHRGSMKLESQPGQGSVFHVYLPLPTLSERPPDLTAPVQPVLLLISSHEEPAAEVFEFSQRRELDIQRLQASDNLDTILQRVQPAALAWDLADARSDDWMIVRRLRNHPRLSQAPFILYGQVPEGSKSLSVGMTGFVPKPMSGDTLMEAINGVCPPRDAGPILIVDDDPQIRDLYQEVIASACPGYPVHVAADGIAALALMAEVVPSLVILDLMMPEMDGFDVLDWMRANDQTRRVPVVILSTRMLNLDDVRRIEQHASVTFQTKGILSKDEAAITLNRAIFGIDTLPQHTSALVKRAVAYFHQNYRHALSRFEIAEAISVSEDYLSRVFRQEMNMSPWEYLNRYRILRAKELLRSTSDDVKNVALRVGFTNPAYFSRMFRKVTGTSPSAYRDHPE
jgi:signal transduction histidine kinase/CheY-like chemotaxis protein